MRLEQPIAVDFSQRQATAQVLARSNLFSSYGEPVAHLNETLVS